MPMPGPAATPDVLIVTVTHNSAPVLPGFLDGIAALANSAAPSVRLRLVDNGSRDDTLSLAREGIARRALTGVDVLPQPDNRGWAAGNNRGLSGAPASEFCLLLNPDVLLAPADLAALCDALRAHPAAGAAAPSLRTAAGARRIPVFPWPTLGDATLGVCGWRRWRVRALQRALAAEPGTRALDGGYAEGCCLLLRRSALQALGPLDERFHLYFDDVDLGRRLRQAGLRTLLVASAQAREAAAKGSRAAPGAGAAEERLARFLAHLRSELRYFEKWHGPRTARALGFYKRWLELGVRGASWRLRYGVRGLARRGREVVGTALAPTHS